MDERVVQAMAQWPNVPDVYDWLSLDARGRWLLRGESVTNPNLIDFINRNYMRTEQGSYAFQNGPQKVHVALEATPWIAFADELDDQLHLQSHNGLDFDAIDSVYLDPDGHLLITQGERVALVRDQDLAVVLPFIQDVHGTPIEAEQLQEWLDGQQSRITLCINTGKRELQHAPARDSWEEFFSYCAKAEHSQT